MKTIVVVMGVSGSGKSTVASLLAERLGCAFQDGDDLHPGDNVEKMRSGIPLTDADRLPWLQAIARLIDLWRERGESGVVTCSALKQAYRRIIRDGRSDVTLVYLKGASSLIHDRLMARTSHFMPVGLLDSQFQALEEPSEDESPIVVDIVKEPLQLVDEIVFRMSAQR